MRLTCLGSGGGRVVVDTQVLPTGGYRITSKSGLEMHLDPGPGAQLHSLARRLSCDPFTLNAIFVSHNHLDHQSDAGVLVECMTFGKKYGSYGTILAPQSVLSGLLAHPSKKTHTEPERMFDKSLSSYFQNMAGKVESVKPGKKVEILNPDVVPYDGARADFTPSKKKLAGGKPDVMATLTPTKTDHEDTSGVGFVLEADGAKLGYTSDTNAFDGLFSQFEGVNTLLVNCLEPDSRHVDYHLSAKDVIDGLESMKKKPTQLVISHFGTAMIAAVPQTQAAKIEKATGVKTLPSLLGLVLEV